MVLRLEKTQAILTAVADKIGEKCEIDAQGGVDVVTRAANLGYLTGICHALDALQDRQTDANYTERDVRPLPKEEKACDEPTFV